MSSRTQVRKTLGMLRPKTLEIQGGETLATKEISPSLARVVAFPLKSCRRAKKIFQGSVRGFVYSRINNPTVDRFEARVAAMVGATAGLATASGMAAIFLVAIALAHGAHIVASIRLYGGVFHLFRELLPKLGISVTFVEDPHDLDEWRRAVRPDTKLFHLEDPSNPLLDTYNVKAISEIAHACGAKLVVDATLASAKQGGPLAHDADIEIHSASKSMGNGRVVGGIILSTQALIDEIRSVWFRSTGPCLAPDNAAIFLGNLESLSSRIEKARENVVKIVDFLEHHPKVKRVYYSKSATGLMAFDIHGGRKEAWRLIDALEVFWLAANIDEAHSLVIHPATTTHGQMTRKERKKAGILESTVRLSIGTGDPDDLIDDLEQALTKI